MLTGMGVSDGIGIGKAWVIEELSLNYIPKAVTDIEEEIQRFRQAVQQFCTDTEKQAAMLKISAGDKEAEILLGHIGIIKDPYLTNETEKRIQNGQCAESAFESVCDRYIALFSSKEDELTQQRALDFRDIKTGILQNLLGVSHTAIRDVPSGTILIAKEITPSMTSEIRKEKIFGMISETGGMTSHSAIIARVLEIPAVMGLKNIMQQVKTGDNIILDGNTGEVIILPNQEQIVSYQQKREKLLTEKKSLEMFRGRRTVSADGKLYELVCNIGNPEDVFQVRECDGEGVGLFRTEFLFMEKHTVPTEEEQFQAYRKAALILKGKPLIIRTLDVGGDKGIDYLAIAKEENPFMGLRAIRYCLKNRDLFKTQLRAIIKASAFGDVRIMFPMITSVEEVRESKTLVEEIKAELRTEKTAFNENIPIGIMMETASAGMIADILAKEVDFFSIGTNDLTGYTMACDRGNSEISYLYSPFQPSVLRMIKRIIECGREQGISVGMCGEAAANPKMIPLLMSFGLTEFSVSAPSVLKVRKCISSFTKRRADEITATVMELTTAREIEEYLKTVIL